MAEHYQTPVAPPRRSRRNLALILVGAGVFIFFANIGLFDSALWGVLWPLALIAFGIDLITEGRQRRRIIRGSVIGLLVLGPLVTGAEWIERGRQPLVGNAPPPLVALGDIDRVEATVKLTAGNLRLEALPDDSEAIANVEQENSPLILTRNERTGIVQLETSGWQDGNVNLALTQRRPLNLTVEVGGGNAEPINLEDVQLQRLNLSVFGGNAEVKLPNAGVMDVTVDSGGGNVSIEVPDDLAVQIQADASFGNVEVDERFQQQNNMYISEGYSDSAPNRAIIRISTTAGNIRIR